MNTVKRLLATAGVLAAAVTSLVITASPAYADAYQTHEIYNVGSRECVTAPAAVITDANLYQSTCGFNGTYWGFATFNNGATWVVNFNNQMCMTASGLYNGAPVVQERCSTPVAGYWQVTDVAFPTATTRVVTLKVFNTNFCLDLENGETQIGLPMQVWTCNPNTNNQKWDYTQETVYG